MSTKHPHNCYRACRPNVLRMSSSRRATPIDLRQGSSSHARAPLLDAEILPRHFRTGTVAHASPGQDVDVEDDKKDTPKFMIPFFNLEADPSIASISLVYFVQGILGLSRLAVSFFFKDELGMDPAETAILTGVTTIPWLIKPVYGFLSDGVPIFGYRRRSYLALCGLLGAGSWLTMSYGVETPQQAVIALTLASLSTACADVVADSLAVERSRSAPPGATGALQSLCWASAAFGGILSAYFSGSLVKDLGPRPVFLLTAGLPLLTALASLLIDEKRGGLGAGRVASGAMLKVDLGGEAMEGGESSLSLAASSVPPGPPTSLTARLRESSLGQGSIALWGAIKDPRVLLPAVFLFCWQATPSADSAMFYFQTEKLGFDAEFLGRVRLVGSVASLTGVAMYNAYFKRTPLRKIFFTTAIIGSVLSLSQLILITGLNREWGLSDKIFCLGDSLVLTVLGQISFMPVLVLAARICPTGVEATLFAALMSVLNGGSAVGGFLGAGLTKYLGVTADHYDNLGLLVTLCSLAALLPLPLLRLLPEGIDEDHDDPGPGSSAAGKDGLAGSQAALATAAAPAGTDDVRAAVAELIPPAGASDLEGGTLRPRGASSR